MLLRAAPGSTGDGLRHRARGRAPRRVPAWTSSTLATCPRRPRASSPRDFVRARAALRAPRDGDQRARRALRDAPPGRRSTSCSGRRASRARAPGTAWPTAALGAARARAHGGGDGRGRGSRRGARSRASDGRRDGRGAWPASPPRSAGCAIDAHARAAAGVFACGADAGGIATGGYASGLAARARVRPDRGARGARGEPVNHSFGSARAVHRRRRGGAAAGRSRDAPARPRRRAACSPAIELPESRAGHEAFLAEIELRSRAARAARPRRRRHRRGPRRGARRGRHADGRRPAPGRRLRRRAAGRLRPLPARGGRDARPDPAHARVRAARARRRCRRRTPPSTR